MRPFSEDSEVKVDECAVAPAHDDTKQARHYGEPEEGQCECGFHVRAVAESAPVLSTVTLHSLPSGEARTSWPGTFTS